MGQQPNIELELDDLPRPEHEPGAPGGWRPSRPGEITTPADMPMGGVFGNPGPDTGWVAKLVKQAEFERETNDIEAVVATIASARASVFGRGPVPDDVEAALIVLGLRENGIDPVTLADLERRRGIWLSKTHHEVVPGRSVLDEIDRSFLHQSVDDMRAGIGSQLG